MKRKRKTTKIQKKKKVIKKGFSKKQTLRKERIEKRVNEHNQTKSK